MNYLKIGHTQFPLDDLKGQTLEQLQKRFDYLPESVVLTLSKEVSPKQEKPKKKIQK